MSEGSTASTSQILRMESIVEGGNTPTKETRNEERTKKIGIEEDKSDRNKFKKVDLPVFSGKDFDSCIFWTERNFQKYKLTDSEKLIVAVIRFDGTTSDWSQSKDERDAFKD